MDSSSKKPLFQAERPVLRQNLSKKLLPAKQSSDFFEFSKISRFLRIVRTSLVEPCFSAKKTIKKVAKLATPTTKMQTISCSFVKAQSSAKEKARRNADFQAFSASAFNTVRKAEKMDVEVEEKYFL